MTVKALYDYEFPSRDRKENFGDDLLVNVHWASNTFFCAPACFRAPQDMSWATFKAEVLDPWAGADPDYEPSAATDWHLDGEPVTPSDATSLADTGVVHKGLITFRT